MGLIFRYQEVLHYLRDEFGEGLLTKSPTYQQFEQFVAKTGARVGKFIFSLHR